MKLLSKFTLTTVLLFAVISMVSAQSYVLSGSQTRGIPGSNAKLESTPVQINKTVTITAVSGDNAGFWISNGSSNVASFWQANDPTAIGTTLKAGTYYVYPNLKQGQNKATITIKLE